MEELEGAVLDAALIAGGQKVEHYEIASYGTLAYFAGLLGHDQAKALLAQTLEEEKMADRKLNDIAKSRVNRDALMAAGMDDEEEEDEEMSMTGQRATADSRSSRTSGGGSSRGGSRGGSRVGNRGGSGGRKRSTSGRRSR
jgi:hypothetical protein